MLLHGNKNIFLTKCSHSISCCIFLFHMVLKLTVSVGNAIDKHQRSRLIHLKWVYDFMSRDFFRQKSVMFNLKKKHNVKEEFKLTSKKGLQRK